MLSSTTCLLTKDHWRSKRMSDKLIPFHSLGAPVCIGHMLSFLDRVLPVFYFSTKIKEMATGNYAEVSRSSFVLVVFAFVSIVPGAEAFDGGDVAALIIGLIIGVLGLCSCLGYYARRRGA